MKSKKLPKSQNELEKRLAEIRRKKELRLIKMKAGYSLVQHDLSTMQDGLKVGKEALEGLRNLGEKSRSPREKMKNILLNTAIELGARYLQRYTERSKDE